VPEWRGRGIGTAVLLHNERRLREIAADHPHDGPRLFATWSILDRFEHTHRLLRRHGYRAVRKSFEMIRPYMDPIPDCPLPSGVELRPVEPAQLRAIWERHAGGVSRSLELHPARRSCVRSVGERSGVAEGPDGRSRGTAIECVGMVLGLVSEDENRKLGKKRIWTESISVRRPWRKRGVARALIAQCLRLGREAGFVEAALGVDAENLSGALGLYEKMGYRTTKQATAVP
jgi:GNAT superfamily N-acetyltransferase